MEDKLVEECNEIADEVKIVGKNEDKCSSCIAIYIIIVLQYYIVLFSIFVTINVGITTYFTYYKYINHNKENISKYDYTYQVKNY